MSEFLNRIQRELFPNPDRRAVINDTHPVGLLDIKQALTSPADLTEEVLVRFGIHFYTEIFLDDSKPAPLDRARVAFVDMVRQEIFGDMVSLLLALRLSIESNNNRKDSLKLIEQLLAEATGR